MATELVFLDDLKQQEKICTTVKSCVVLSNQHAQGKVGSDTGEKLNQISFVFVNFNLFGQKTVLLKLRVDQHNITECCGQAVSAPLLH
jgi:ABC-type polar amino acid transport system ATPase subunit